MKTNETISQAKSAFVVSLILPIRNEAEFIEGTLRALATQTYDKRHFEVIVADGASEDNTKNIVKQFAVSHPTVRIRLIDNPGRIYSTGFNLGLQSSLGDAVIFTSGHTELSPDYVKECAHYLQTTDAACVGGISITKGTNKGAQMVTLAMGSRFGLGGAAFRVVRNQQIRQVETVAYGAYRRSVFDLIGGLDEELIRNQDDEFNYRLRRAGGKILLIPSITATYYSPRSDLKQLWKQYFEFGYWKVRVMQKHPRQMSPRQFVPPIFITSLIAGPILGLFWPVCLVSSLGLLGLYISLNLLASFTLAAKAGWQYYTRLPLTFAILHFGYGLGFLKGLIVFGYRFFGKEPDTLP